MPKHDCKSHRKLEKKTESTQITKKQLFIKKIFSKNITPIKKPNAKINH
jgi:hypothetical protein